MATKKKNRSVNRKKTPGGTTSIKKLGMAETIGGLKGNKLPGSNEKSIRRKTGIKTGTKATKLATRRSAAITFRKRRTFQRTDVDAVERNYYKATKGKKPVSNTESAEKILKDTLKKAVPKFSRKKGEKYAARITLKWKSKEGKWVYRSLLALGDNFNEAVENLLKHEEINSLTYERKDDGHEGEKKRIHSKHKLITGVSFDKYVTRKVLKTARNKTGKKKARRIRH